MSTRLPLPSGAAAKAACRPPLPLSGTTRAAEASAAGPVESWRARLLEGGEAALGEFLAEHPAADRQIVPSAIAEEDETLYAQYGVPRIPPAIPYIAPDDLPVPGDDLSDPDLPYWLALNRAKGIGPARFRHLLDAFGSAAEAWSADAHAWRAAGLDTRTTEALERQRTTIVPDAELERLIKLRVRAVRFISS